MSKHSLWGSYTAKYQKWKDSEYVVKMKANGLKNMIQQAYEDGQKAGFKAGEKKGYKSGYELGQKKSDPMNMFNNVFKK